MNTNKKFIYKFWSYDISQNLETLPDKILDTFKPKGRFYDDALSLYEILTISPHPSMSLQSGKEIVDPSTVVFDNILTDINTLRILLYLLPHTRIVSLKFSKPSYEYSNLEYLVNGLLQKPNNISHLYIEWCCDIRNEGSIYKNPEVNYDLIEKTNIFNLENNLLSEDIDDNTVKAQNQKESLTINNHSSPQILLKSKMTLARLALNTKLETLCLRGCFIGDVAGVFIFENLKNSSIKNLNLFKNSLTDKTTKSITDLILVNTKLEELNLGGNFYKNSSFYEISQQLGKTELNDEEIEVYNKKLKEKNEVIEKNKKLKASKKPEAPLPFLAEVDVVGERYFMIKNKTLKSINFMQNVYINKGVYKDILKAVERTEEVLFIFDNKIFEKSERDKLSDSKNKFSSKVYLVK